MDTLILEADVNGNRAIDMDEFILLHSRHPWYAEQVRLDFEQNYSNRANKSNSKFGTLKPEEALKFLLSDHIHAHEHG